MKPGPRHSWNDWNQSNKCGEDVHVPEAGGGGSFWCKCPVFERTRWHCAECFEGEGKTGKVKQKSHGRSGSKAGKDGKGRKTKETKAKGAGKGSLKELCCSAFCTIFVLSWVVLHIGVVCRKQQPHRRKRERKGKLSLLQMSQMPRRQLEAFDQLMAIWVGIWQGKSLSAKQKKKKEITKLYSNLVKQGRKMSQDVARTISLFESKNVPLRRAHQSWEDIGIGICREYAANRFLKFWWIWGIFADLGEYCIGIVLVLDLRWCSSPQDSQSRRHRQGYSGNSQQPFDAKSGNWILHWISWLFWYQLVPAFCTDVKGFFYSTCFFEGAQV